MMFIRSISVLMLALLVAGTVSAAGTASAGAGRGKDVLKDYEPFNVEKTPHLFSLNVVDYLGLAWKYDTPAKREAYRQTELYRKQLADLEQVRAKSADKLYRTPVFLKQRDNNKPGTLQLHVTDVYIKDVPYAIVKPSPLTTMEGEVMKSQFRHMDRRYYIQTYEVPVAEEVKAMLIAKGKVNYYLVFRVTGMKHVSDDTNVRPATDVVSVEPVRFLAVLDGSGEVLVDKALTPQRAAP